MGMESLEGLSWDVGEMAHNEMNDVQCRHPRGPAVVSHRDPSIALYTCSSSFIL